MKVQELLDDLNKVDPETEIEIIVEGDVWGDLKSITNINSEITGRLIIEIK